MLVVKMPRVGVLCIASVSLMDAHSLFRLLRSVSVGRLSLVLLHLGVSCGMQGAGRCRMALDGTLSGARHNSAGREENS